MYSSYLFACNFFCKIELIFLINHIRGGIGMKVIGIILIIWGVLGIIMGMMMFGDIGIACIVGAVTAILSGVGFLLGGKTIKKNAN